MTDAPRFFSNELLAAAVKICDESLHADEIALLLADSIELPMHYYHHLERGELLAAGTATDDGRIAKNIQLTELGHAVVMALRVRSVWPKVTMRERKQLGNPCWADAELGNPLATLGLCQSNESCTYNGRKHESYRYIRTELGRIGWVLDQWKAAA